ncbi:BREX-1 system adenine-specific DNA-methyltransferase PglX [Vreelandella aquamarina]|uniref:site-specific DNA-methyltransferase (adenine-specific) n=1 Tax=Vreelandella aquamarina TaxID=77097 RepID=A0A857GUD1_9GAMM|nr:BREX-1 system adenine-specific DNA-methyltransferase PglX [Halomonas meridiana]QHD51211.1 SAM-dependent methyltransferase [Halomonas meridiana]
METAKLKKFAQFARRSLLEQVTAKLKLVLADESPARRERPQAIKKLEEAVTDQGKEQVIERVAYIWFNRFCALRFMDVNRYNRIGIVSPAEGQFQPEILADAKMGHIDEEMVSESTRQKIFALLDGKTPSQDPQGEAYRLLVVAACNYWYSAMPFLFERIDDYTELLMPDDLLSGNSILAYTREAMTPDACEDVEVIGWLYQFYISEKKDQVFADLKKNKKVTPENIPAATQLFTPHWIVRYLVENSLGRLWMLNRPNSGLIEQMDYYIKPEEPETDFLRINSPEEIKICDPACGSGHMLTYAFDLLYAIYEEEGYEPADIPAKILAHNLYGIEIDERAGELAAFALTMKARARQRRFFNKNIKPNICVLEKVSFSADELNEYMSAVGRDLFTQGLRETLQQFEEADNFGSLIVPKLTNVTDVLAELETKDLGSNLFLADTHSKVLKVLRMADVLSPKYHVVVANPPYMGAGGMNARLKNWIENNYSAGKSDLMTAFILACQQLTRSKGVASIVTLDSWMFLSSYKNLRSELINRSAIQTLLHVGWNCFPDGHVYNRGVGFTIQSSSPKGIGQYINLSNVPAVVDKRSLFRSKLEKGDILAVDSADFLKIPSYPIAYWLPNFSIFEGALLRDFWTSGGRLKTHGSDRYIRYVWEVSKNKKHWRRLTKGGEVRKHYGNEEHLVDWSDEAVKHYDSVGGLYPSSFQAKEGITWTKVTSANPTFRIKRDVAEYDSGGPVIFDKDFRCDFVVLAALNSHSTRFLLNAINPTINTQVNDVLSLPLADLKPDLQSIVGQNERNLVELSKSDWDDYETSWDFTRLPLLSTSHRAETLASTYTALRAHWQSMTDEMQRLEEENNRIFIGAYGLQDELSPEVPIEEITLTCNPAYRYGVKGSEEDRENRLRADTMAEFISYAVGCMFGRYALDKPGLILANQGETIEDYLKQIPKPSFPADDDNVIPMLDGDWFTDDITERFREFLRIAFGEEHYEENLRFVEQALGKDIRKYFLKDFYNDHVRRYKKRPIYWLFSSPKGSFNALIYMHRYQPHTVGTVLEYLRDFKDEKLKARKNHLEAVSISAGASQGDKTKALKEIEKINKILAELDDYERDVLYPLATEQVEIDLDDGVKANYPKFGDALKKIPGLS